MQRRRTKKTRLVYCEGAEDKAFLDCLKPLYIGDEYNVDVKRGTGGDQVHLVEEAIRKGEAYDEKYLKIDGDRDTAEMDSAEQLANEQELVILKTTPNIERLLINILEPTKNITSWNSARCKSYFERQYIPADKRTDVRAYKAIFTKAVLEAARARLTELEEVIRVFQ